MVRRWRGAGVVLRGVAVLGVVVLGVAGCSDVAGTAAPGGSGTTSAPAPSVSGVEPSGSEPSGGESPTRTPSRPPATGPTPSPTVERKAPTAMRMTVPEIGLDGIRVVAYNGTADDRPGTDIQDRGVLATPRGPRGGVGPGEVGNFIVTGHRTTHGRPFGRLPELRNGDHVLVTADGTVYDYVIVRTMTISFRRPAEIAAQNAAVPGHPGQTPTRAMITLSTCATPEDHAQGNYWKDALGNPEHRINKIGVLVATRPA